MLSSAEDADLRREAMAFLTVLTEDGQRSVGAEDLRDFRFRDEPFRLMDRQRGITKPANLTAALSIRTVYRREGEQRPYEDQIRADGLVEPLRILPAGPSRRPDPVLLAERFDRFTSRRPA